jgi:hypothetical protein
MIREILFSENKIDVPFPTSDPPGGIIHKLRMHVPNKLPKAIRNLYVFIEISKVEFAQF